MNLMSQQGVTTTRSEFLQAIRNAFADAAALGCREVWISDEDFSDWPLSERSVIDSLNRWAGPHRRLTVLAAHFDEFQRYHARFIEWRRQWAHVVECYVAEDAQFDSVPPVLLAPGVVTVQVLDRASHRVSVSLDEAEALRCHQRLDAVLQRSSGALPATVLGL